MNIIIAPHADDELIGCYSLIKRKLIHSVWYIDSPPARFEYAKKAGEELGFFTSEVDFRDLHTALWGSNNTLTTFLVPDIADNHLLHKAVNCIGRLSGAKLGYYTTDMNTGYVRELSEDDKREKREVLNRFYPDQSSLWERDWKYFLFEGVVYDTLTTTATLPEPLY